MYLIRGIYHFQLFGSWFVHGWIVLRGYYWLVWWKPSSRPFASPHVLQIVGDCMVLLYIVVASTEISVIMWTSRALWDRSMNAPRAKHQKVMLRAVRKGSSEINQCIRIFRQASLYIIRNAINSTLDYNHTVLLKNNIQRCGSSPWFCCYHPWCMVLLLVEVQGNLGKRVPWSPN